MPAASAPEQEGASFGVPPRVCLDPRISPGVAVGAANIGSKLVHRSYTVLTISRGGIGQGPKGCRFQHGMPGRMISSDIFWLYKATLGLDSRSEPSPPPFPPNSRCFSPGLAAKCNALAPVEPFSRKKPTSPSEDVSISLERLSLAEGTPGLTAGGADSEILRGSECHKGKGQVATPLAGSASSSNDGSYAQLQYNMIPPSSAHPLCPRISIIQPVNRSSAKLGVRWTWPPTQESACRSPVDGEQLLLLADTLRRPPNSMASRWTCSLQLARWWTQTEFTPHDFMPNPSQSLLPESQEAITFQCYKNGAPIDAHP